MKSKGVTLSKHLIRAGVVLVVAMGASACSTVPDWVDPTNWIGGDDQAATTPADQGTQTADNGQTPDLSAIPDKPQTPSTSDEQRDVAQSLQSDRSKAEYSADALRGGTEAAAAPPPAEAAPSTEELASNDNAAPAAPPPSVPAAPPPPPAAGPGTLPSDSTAAQAASAPAPAPTQAVAAAPMPAPSAEPAVPAVPAAATPAVSVASPQMPTTDMALGFRPSSAPALDASVAQFVPPSILARYRETAAIGPGPAVPDGTAYAANPPSKKRAKQRQAGMGGPENMSGAVVANFDSLQGSAVAPSGAGLPGGPQAVVYFPHDTTILNDEAKAQVRATAKAFIAQGGTGYVRVIGHSSSGASSMTAQRHLVWNFERSQARANAVARALIREGVPADKVLVQAASDEEAPQGEDGNRRAEIFFQS